MIRRTLSQAAIIIGALVFAIGLQAFAFSQPSSSPPNSDAYAPLNTSNAAQTKTGGLLLNTGNATNGLIVQYGKVGIGVTSPAQKLSVAGYIQSTSGGFEFPDGTVQTTAKAFAVYQCPRYNSCSGASDCIGQIQMASPSQSAPTCVYVPTYFDSTTGEPYCGSQTTVTCTLEGYLVK